MRLNQRFVRFKMASSAEWWSSKSFVGSRFTACDSTDLWLCSCVCTGSVWRTLHSQGSTTVLPSPSSKAFAELARSCRSPSSEACSIRLSMHLRAVSNPLSMLMVNRTCLMSWLFHLIFRFVEEHRTSLWSTCYKCRAPRQGAKSFVANQCIDLVFAAW